MIMLQSPFDSFNPVHPWSSGDFYGAHYVSVEELQRVFCVETNLCIIYGPKKSGKTSVFNFGRHRYDAQAYILTIDANKNHLQGWAKALFEFRESELKLIYQVGTKLQKDIVSIIHATYSQDITTIQELETLADCADTKLVINRYQELNEETRKIIRDDLFKMDEIKKLGLADLHWAAETGQKLNISSENAHWILGKALEKLNKYLERKLLTSSGSISLIVHVTEDRIDNYKESFLTLFNDAEPVHWLWVHEIIGNTKNLDEAERYLNDQRRVQQSYDLTQAPGAKSGFRCKSEKVKIGFPNRDQAKQLIRLESNTGSVNGRPRYLQLLSEDDQKQTQDFILGWAGYHPLMILQLCRAFDNELSDQTDPLIRNRVQIDLAVAKTLVERGAKNLLEEGRDAWLVDLWQIIPPLYQKALCQWINKGIEPEDNVSAKLRREYGFVFYNEAEKKHQIPHIVREYIKKKGCQMNVILLDIVKKYAIGKAVEQGERSLSSIWESVMGPEYLYIGAMEDAIQEVLKFGEFQDCDLPEEIDVSQVLKYRVNLEQMDISSLADPVFKQKVQEAFLNYLGGASDNYSYIAFSSKVVDVAEKKFIRALSADKEGDAWRYAMMSASLESKRSNREIFETVTQIDQRVALILMMLGNKIITREEFDHVETSGTSLEQDPLLLAAKNPCNELYMYLKASLNKRDELIIQLPLLNHEAPETVRKKAEVEAKLKIAKNEVDRHTEEYVKAECSKVFGYE